MKVSKDFYFDVKTLCYTFSLTATVEGKKYKASVTVKEETYIYGKVPLYAMWHDLQKKIMRAIEKDLFGE